MAFIKITCKKATYLITKKEEGKLSFKQMMQLKAHLYICSLCKLFQKQNSYISMNAKHIHLDIKLSKEAKARIAETLKY